MAQIPGVGVFGNAIAQPQQAVNMPVVSTGAGAQAIGGALRSIADAERREAEEMREAANKLKATSELQTAEDGLTTSGGTVAEGTRTGTVDKTKAVAEFGKLASARTQQAAKNLPDEHREIGQVHLAGRVSNFSRVIGKAVTQRDRQDVDSGIDQALEHSSRLFLTDPKKADQKANDVLDQMGPYSGRTPAEIQQKRQAYKEASRFNLGRALVNGARDSNEELGSVLGLLGGNEFADLSPEKKLSLEKEITARQQYLKHQADADLNRQRIEADRLEQETYGTALLEVETTGKVSRNLWLQLKDGHRASILNRQKAEAKAARIEAEGRPIRTDWTLYLTLREQADSDPKGFAKLDLKEYVDRIGGSQLEQLQDIKTRNLDAITGLLKNKSVTLTQQMNATMQTLGIKRAESKGKFLSFVQGAVDDATQAKGNPLSFDERQKIIDTAVLKGPDPDALFFGQKRMFELTGEQRTRFKPNAATDAPDSEINAINEALKAQGLPQTPANRLSLYNRVKGAP